MYRFEGKVMMTRLQIVKVNFAAIYASYISLSTCKITKSKGNMQITVRTLLKINIRKE